MLKVGQKLWLVTNRNKTTQYSVTVTKVGRRWADITPDGWSHAIHRIDINTLRVDSGGYNSQGRCYLSEAEYKAERQRNIAWDGFRRRVWNAWSIPDSTTSECIAQAEELLFGLKQQEEEKSNG